MADSTFPLAGLSTRPGRVSFIITIVSLFLASVALALRVYAKVLVGRPLKPHDYLYFAAYVFTIGFSIDFLYGIYPGVLGMHIEDVTRLYPNRLEMVLQIFFASASIWATSTTLIKLSLLDLYLGVFRSNAFRTKAFRNATWAVGACSILFTIAYILTAFLMCRPLAFNWDKTIEGGKCGDAIKQEIGSAAANMVLDFLIVLLPLPVLWTLQMPWRKKVLLSCIFSLGLGICAMNITRIILIVYQNETDFTHAITLIGLFAILEVNIGMICASLPTLGPLLFVKRGSSGRGSSDRSSENMNTFARLRAAGVNRFQGRSGKSTLFSTVDDLDPEAEAIPLREVGGCQRDGGGDVGTAPGDKVESHRFEGAANADGNGESGSGRDNIRVQTDILVTSPGGRN